MLSLKENLENQAQYAKKRVDAMRYPMAFLSSSCIAGAFIGLGVLFMLTAGGPFLVARHPAASIIGGSVFGIGLILVVVSGAQLLTSAMMVLPIGLARKTITLRGAAASSILMYFGNFIGSLVLAVVIVASGLVRPGTPAGEYLSAVVHHKAHHTITELVFLGVLCNIFVCLAVWGAAATENAAAKVAIIAWCVAAFVASGTEHVVANMTIFSAALFQGVDGIAMSDLLRNQLWVCIGNALGGGAFIAAPLLMSDPRPSLVTSVK
ncbi:formate/nitrite transporter family protein [Corynebacterium freiburgense]|uniref:formate/nitrite transporter family protein n=1 Tax=Corynebacterium freiburgense TaxID=556548 RepID=UPI0003F9C335|nr:formate/nitrite transporter family protein [Corynebacterium freiburgense]WJZ02981.1 Nitrite transporter NirC [Corynebacterium freiburgense]